LSTSMCWSADGVAVSHPISLIHIVHVTVIILHNEWFHSVSLLIAEITFGWCVMNIHQHVNISCLSTELLSGQVTCGPYWNVAPFHFYFLGSKILWYDHPVCSDRCTSGYRICWEESKCPCSVFDYTVHFHSQSCHCGMCCCQVLCHEWSFPTYH